MMERVSAAAIPWLMLAEKDGMEESREFFELSKEGGGVGHSMSFPELVGKRCLGVGFPGWVFTADEEGKMNLFHFPSRSLIQLPDMDMLDRFDRDVHKKDMYYVEKAVISSDPNDDEGNYVLALIQGYPRTFAFWRPGRKSFFSAAETPERAYADITWHEGQFYGVDFMGNIIIFDFRAQDSILARVVRGIPPSLTSGTHLYIVYSLGELLVITREGVFPDEDGSYGLEEFRVYKIDIVASRYEEVKDLGNRAIFLGSSATLVAEQADACKGNSIYFTDDCWQSYFSIERGGGKDMGIYNLLDGTIEPHFTGESYHKFCPPLWILT